MTLSRAWREGAQTACDTRPPATTVHWAAPDLGTRTAREAGRATCPMRVRGGPGWRQHSGLPTRSHVGARTCPCLGPSALDAASPSARQGPAPPDSTGPGMTRSLTQHRPAGHIVLCSGACRPSAHQADAAGAPTCRQARLVTCRRQKTQPGARVASRQNHRRRASWAPGILSAQCRPERTGRGKHGRPGRSRWAAAPRLDLGLTGAPVLTLESVAVRHGSRGSSGGKGQRDTVQQPPAVPPPPARPPPAPCAEERTTGPRACLPAHALQSCRHTRWEDSFLPFCK